MKALKHNGLVLATVAQPFRNYRVGETVRLNPQDAQRYMESGFVTEAKLPKGAQTVSVQAPQPDLASTRILPQVMPAIPENWTDLHYLQRHKLAEQIAGRPVKGAEADKIIEDELKRRAAE